MQIQKKVIMHTKKHQRKLDIRNMERVRVPFVICTRVITLYSCYMRMHSISASQKRNFFIYNITSPLAETGKSGFVQPTSQKRFDSGFHQTKNSWVRLATSLSREVIYDQRERGFWYVTLSSVRKRGHLFTPFFRTLTNICGPTTQFVQNTCFIGLVLP